MASVPSASSQPPAPGVDRKLTLKEILEWLVQDGRAAREDAARLLADHSRARAGRHPITIIAEAKLRSPVPPNGPLNAEMLTAWLGARLQIPFFHIDPLKIDLRAVTDVMSSEYAQRRGILPVGSSGKEVTIATCEPFMRAWEAELAEMLRVSVKRVIANPVDIERYQGEFYNLAKSVKRAEKAGVQTSGLSNFEQLVELGKAGRQLDANDHHIVHLVDWLWQYAFDQRASDIHLEPRRDVGIIRFRIDGVLHEVYQIPYPVLVAMTSRIKILGRMDVVEKRRPQDGRIKTRMPDGEEIELRLSTLPTAHGEKVVMRIFDPEVLTRDFGDLGFTKDEQETWHHLTSQPGGILLVTGPTGSGKTTTLYTTLKQLATPEVNVCTIEDPIEMVDPRLNQMQVNADIDLTFATGVRALMRQDPDIIMVGEIRDLETADMAVQAALTGHLVLSTLHTNDAPSAVTRLLDLGAPPYLLNATLLGVMAQRLVRTLCPHCKQKAPFQREDDHATWNAICAPFKSTPPAEVWRPVGCLECRNTGYLGRVGIYEILTLTVDLKRLLVAEPDLVRLTEACYRAGMRPLRLSGLMKVAQGITTIEEVLKVAPV
ncbi:MAG: Flp pilus assembly complex ATPase component TadA [Burkholderiales bacterium]|nr:Flp pilus assembly complex ATPase component TadA [Burkholderiales bacterium]